MNANTGNKRPSRPGDERRPGSAYPIFLLLLIVLVLSSDVSNVAPLKPGQDSPADDADWRGSNREFIRASREIRGALFCDIQFKT